MMTPEQRTRRLLDAKKKRSNRILDSGESSQEQSPEIMSTKKRVLTIISSDEEEDVPPVKKNMSKKTQGMENPPTTKRKKTKASSSSSMVPTTDSVAASVLKKVVDLTEKVKKSSTKAPKTLAQLNILNAREVREMTESTVSDEIERLIFQAALSIIRGDGLRFQVPTRSSSNQIYVPELDRIVLADKVSSRQFTSTSTVRKTTITARVMQLVHQLLNKGIHVTKRDLFYTDVKLFVDQGESDTVLDDVACMVGCTRTSLNVVASEKGVVVGRIMFRDDGDLIDCTRMGVGGKAIPPYMDRITDIQSDAKFILLVEKDAAFMRLAEDRFYNKFPCIILTAKGQPDVATRMFLRKIKEKLQLPVLGLVDSDPYGLKILSVYMSGSKNMSYDSANLTTPDIKWLGVRPSDLQKYKIPDQCRLKMKDSDMKTGRDMLEEDFIKKNPAWYKELELMLKTKEKAEIQALSTFGFQFLTQEYLPKKIQQGDWI